jgi:hypothetical protein
VVLIFSSNAVATNSDSIRVRYTSVCGNSLNRAVKLSNTALNPPAAPASITITPLQTNVCGARRYRYTAPNLPIATATAGAATGWSWSMVGALSGTATIDSGTLQSQKVVLIFSSNASATSGDSMRVRYTSGCGQSLYRSIRFSNTLLNPPTAPALITIQQVLPDSCGFRRYRYLAPNLPAATSTSGAETGYLWSMPTGAVGSTGVLDSGVLTGQRIRISYSSNAAAGTGDSIRVRYNSGCGTSNPKAQRLSNLLRSCPGSQRLPISLPISKATNQPVLYPNPNAGSFYLNLLVANEVVDNMVQLEIYDPSGKKCWHQSAVVQNGMLQRKIDLYGLRKGIYWLRCFDKSGWIRNITFQIQ